ncbi:MAG TPA: cytoplasmic protein, partial [Streptomyces sp.]|nr:cytoplasmic protein [Streptomyces sp.]
RTCLTEETVSGLFLLESLAPMPVADLETAAAELAETLAKFSPSARIEVHAPALK